MKLSCVVVIVAIIVVSQPTLAQWTDNSQVNTQIAGAPISSDEHVMVSDGAGGAIIAWRDYRTSYFSHIYAQRVSASGAVLWVQNGVPICTADSGQLAPVMVSDGAGGAIIAWQDSRNGSWDIYAQRVNGAGTVQWAQNGVGVSLAVGDQQEPAIASDGSGGAILTWFDNRALTNPDIYVQRLNGSGVAQWTTNGVALCSASYNQLLPVIVSDDSGGAIVTWEDRRSNVDWDIYAARINSAGVAPWTANGVPVCTASADQLQPAMVKDGAGGAIVAWQDARLGGTHIYAQRISASGAAQWQTDGVSVCGAAGSQFSADIATDGLAGAIIAWSDLRNGVNTQAYAQHVNSSGVAQWQVNGMAICSTSYAQDFVKILSDGSAGAIVTWSDQRNSSYDVYAQHVNKNGTIVWSGGGVAVCSAPNDQTNQVLVGSGTSGVILAWQDKRSGTSMVYAQKIGNNGALGDGTPYLQAVRDVRNDQGGFVDLLWAPSPYDALPDQSITGYTVWRGVKLHGYLGSAATNSGPVFARKTVIQTSTFGGSVVSSVAADTIGWQEVGTVSAAYRSMYSFVSPTLSDSTPLGTPYYYFMITANTGNPMVFWDSPIDSGYSVDNLPPSVVAHLGGSFAGGTETLHWDANTETDLAGYVVYRSTSASINPATQTPLGTTTNDFYVDPGAGVGNVMFYAVQAVDIHGNRSPLSAVISTISTSVQETSSLPTVFALGRNYPNPFNPSTMITFDVPRSTVVRVTVYDLLGRDVAELVNSTKTPGRYAVEWNADKFSSGIYYVRMETQGFVGTRKLVLMK